MRRVLFLGKEIRCNLWGNEGVIGGEGLRITYIPGRVYRALDMSLIHESHVNGTEKVAS